MLDKAGLVLSAVEAGPASLADLVARTGLSRATAHRLAVALEVHRLVGRDGAGRFVPGPRLASAAGGDRLVAAAGPVLRALRDETGESTQLYVRRGDVRVCVAAAERESGLRDTVPVGSALPLTAGSGAQVLLAWEPDVPGELLAAAAFDAGVLARVRTAGYAASVGQREAGLGSVSAPVRAPRPPVDNGSTPRPDAVTVVAALSLSGPLERLTRAPGRRHGAAVVAAADRLSRAL